MTSFQPAALAASSERVDQSLADALAAKHRLDDQRAEQQRRRVADDDRGHRVGADHQRADPRDEAERRIGVGRLADAVGGAGEPAGAEHALVEPLDRLGVVGRLGFEDKGKLGHGPRP